MDLMFSLLGWLDGWTIRNKNWTMAGWEGIAEGAKPCGKGVYIGGLSRVFTVHTPWTLFSIFGTRLFGSS